MTGATLTIVTARLAEGGAEFVASAWAQEMQRRGWPTTLVTYAEGRVDNTLEHQHIDLRVQGAHTHVQRISALRAILKSQRGGIALSLLTYPNILLLSASLGLRTRPILGISERNIPSILLRQQGRSQRTQLHLAKRLYRKADFGIAISHPVAAEMVGLFRIVPERVYVVPNPATAKGPRRHHTYCASAERHLQLIMPGRLVPQKRPHLVLRVADVLQSRGWKVNVVFAGSGPLEGSLRAASQSSNVRAQFPGWQERWWEVAQSRNCVVLLPSSCEGFGNVLVEAAAAGIPSVATSQALGVADAILPGLTGVLTVSAEPACLADGVERAVTIDTNAATAWLQRFSVAQSCDALEIALASAAVK